MSKFHLDLSKFKKMHGDDKSTTLRHERGHTITVAHGALSPRVRGQLAALPVAEKQHFADGGGPVITAPEFTESYINGPKAKPKQGPTNSAVSTSEAVKKGQEETYAAHHYEKPAPVDCSKPAATMSTGEAQACLADGGEVDSSTRTVGDIINYPGSPKSPKPSPSPQHYDDGGMVQMAEKLAPLIAVALAKGGYLRQGNPKLEEAHKTLPRANYAEPTGTVSQDDLSDIIPPNASQMTDEAPRQSNPTGPALPYGGMNQQQLQDYVAVNPGPQAATGENGNNPETPAPTPAQPMTQQSSQNVADSSDKQEMESDQVPGTEAPPQPAQPQQPMTPADVKQAHMNEYAAEDKAWAQDLANQHITPKTYADMFATHPDGTSRGTLSKIGTIFGMLLGGIGSGLTGQPNALMQMMNNQISNDLEAQKQSKSNAQNFLRLTYQHELQKAQAKQVGALTDAQRQEIAIKSDAFTRMKMNRAALQEQIIKAQGLPGPEQQKAQAVLAMMANGVNNENYNIADRAASQAALLNYAAGNTSGDPNSPQTVSPEQQFQNETRMLRLSGNEKLANDKESKHVPGFVGSSSAPLTTPEKNELTKYVSFDQQLGRYTDWAKQHSGLSAADPRNIPAINQGRTLARNLQSAYRENLLNTVYKAGEQPLLDQTIDSDPTKFLNKWRVIPQLEALRSENAAQLQTAAKNKGFTGYQGFAQPNKPSLNPQQQSMADWAKRNPNDPRAAQVLKKLGV